MSMRSRPVLIVLALAAAALVVAACSQAVPLSAPTAQRSSGGGPVPAPAVDESAAKAGTTQAGAPNLGGYVAQQLPPEKVLILTASLELRDRDPWAASAKIRAIARTLGGEVVSVSETGKGDDRVATVTVRVPNERFDDALDQIKRTGEEVLNTTVKSEDRTEQFVDLEARLKAKQAEEARYLALLNRAEKVEDILRVEQVLANVRAQIEQLQGQLNFLKNRSAMATITATVTTSAPAFPSSGWQPQRTFEQALAALTRLLQGMADLAIWTLVWLWLPLLALGALALVARRVRPA